MPPIPISGGRRAGGLEKKKREAKKRALPCRPLGWGGSVGAARTRHSVRGPRNIAFSGNLVSVSSNERTLACTTTFTSRFVQCHNAKMMGPLEIEFSLIDEWEKEEEERSENQRCEKFSLFFQLITSSIPSPSPPLLSKTAPTKPSPRPVGAGWRTKARAADW